MTIKSHRTDLSVKEGNILDWLFPEGSAPSDKPLWIDAASNEVSLSPKQLVPWVKRVGYGLQTLGVRAGDSLLVFTPNHIFVPVAYLGTVCLGCAFSGASPAFTVKGRSLHHCVVMSSHHPLACGDKLFQQFKHAACFVAMLTTNQSSSTK
jgi:acyl-coenzyme A synthetase/AMP-(fatty) acid ligase